MSTPRSSKIVIGFFIVGCIILAAIAVSLNQRVGRETVAQKQPAPEPTPPSLFLAQFPAEQFKADDNLKRPDFADLRSAAYLGGYVYLAAFNSVVKLDATTGAIVAYSDPLLLPGPKYVAELGGKLFVATFDHGVYQINGATERIEYHYDITNGLQDIANLEVTSDGSSIWVSTYSGVARINPTTHVVDSYTDALVPGSACQQRAVAVEVIGGHVVATLTASSACAGGISIHNTTKNSWTYFGPQQIDPKLGERIEVGAIAPSANPNELYIVSHDNKHEVIRKLDLATSIWTVVKTLGTSFDSSRAELDKMSPPENYAPFIFAGNPNERALNIRVRKPDGTFTATPYEKIGYSFVGTEDGVNYFTSARGLEAISTHDLAPHVLVTASRFIPDVGAPRLFVSADKKFLLAYFADASAYDGSISAYKFIAYDKSKGEGFSVYIDTQPTDSAMSPNYAPSLSGESDVYSFVNELGIKFRIDEAGKTITRGK